MLVFATAVNPTEPFPDPELGPLMVNHAALLPAVHAQPAGALTPTAPLPPPDAMVCEVGVISIVQVIGSCVTEYAFPPIVNVPVREEPVALAAALTPTDPLPVPDAPLVTVSQPLLLTAVHAHPAGAVTDTVAVPPPEGMPCVVGAMVVEQLMPAWDTVKVLPATVTVPVRDAIEVFAAALIVTEPLPDPDAPAVTVNHASLLAAVHEHAAGELTATVAVPPLAGTLCDEGEIVAEQMIPVCVTVKVLPAIVSVPVRDVAVVFAAALNVTDPLPDPDVPAVTVSHASLLVAVHAQPPGAVMATVPLPPPDATPCDVGAIVSLQLIPACVIVNMLPAMVIVPVRALVVVFAVVLKATEPFPEPEAPPLVTVIQPLLLVAVHAHPFGAVTSTTPAPPEGATLCDVGAIVSVQTIPDCVTVNVLPAIVSVPLR